MPRRWLPQFDSYEADVEDARALFSVDLGAAGFVPVKSHGLRLQVRVAMKHPRGDGLRGDEETDALFAVEDVLVEDLTRARDAIYVGRFVSEGYTTWVFYLPSSDYEEAPLKAVRDVAPYTFEWLAEPDPEWTGYRDFLYPDPYALQRMLNRQLLQVREQEGDRPEIERQVDHMAYFPDEARARAAAAALSGRGFRVGEPASPQEEGGAWGLEFYRPERLDGDRADQIVVEILDLILPLEGDYDGWGALIMRGE